MSSAQKSALRSNFEVQFAEPLHGSAEPPRFPNLNHAIEASLRARRIELSLEHRDLDLTICALSEAATCDELLLSRLKKRRLHLKDEIARIEGSLPA